MSGDDPTRPPILSPAGAPNPYSPPAAAIDEGSLPAIEGSGFKSALPLANAITITMGFFIVAELLVVVCGALAIGVMNRVLAGETVPEAQLVAIDDRARALSLLLVLLLVAAAVLTCLFMPRANHNVRAFGSSTTNTPGWAAGWFFVPIAGLWKPYYAMKEIWQGSDPESVGVRDPTAHAAMAPVPALLPLWWWMYLAFLFSRQIWSAGGKRAQDAATFVSMSWGRMIVSAITVVAAALAAAVVRAVARRQDERQRRSSTGKSLPKGGAGP